MCGPSLHMIKINKIFKTIFIGLNDANKENLTHSSECNLGLFDTNYLKVKSLASA